jgi:hypothetical protein
MKSVSFNPMGGSGMYLMSGEERDLAPDILDASGRLKIMPASYYESTTPQERIAFCVKHGVYNLPTHEQVDALRDIIGSKRTIEIGSGNGVLAKELGIPATDNFMQERKDVLDILDGHGQMPVPYGPNVERIDGVAALGKYHPHTILACWLTHLYRPKHHARGGNVLAPDEKALLKGCSMFVMVGNTHTHRNHPFLNIPHKRITAEWLYSRAIEGTNFIGIWKGRKF